MIAPDLQQICEKGQEQLMRMEYLQAERTLAEAEQSAWTARDFDSLSRLYMPLQEARRQRRQRAGEGIVRLDLLATGPDDPLNAPDLLHQYPHGQLVIAGWATLQPAIEARRLQAQQNLYVDIFLAAVYPIGAGRIVAILPTADVQLPAPDNQSIDSLIRRLPPHTILIPESELPRGQTPGSPQTYARVMDLWERLHAPFLAAADSSTDPIRKIEGYRKTIEVDYATELAHQHISDLAKQLSRPR